MIVLRSLLFYAFFIPCTISIAMLVLITRIFGREAAWQVGHLWGWCGNALLRLFCGINVKVEGREHIPSEPCVIVSNHQSTWETTTFPTVFPPFVWILKKELLYIPIFGWALFALGSIAIVRSNPREALKQVNTQGQAQLQAGRCVVVFPEGTRMPAGKPGKYQPSAVMLAKQAKVAILPVAHNAGVCWPKGKILKYPGTITIRILPPIAAEDVQAKKRNDILTECETRIIAACQDIGG